MYVRGLPCIEQCVLRAGTQQWHQRSVAAAVDAAESQRSCSPSSSVLRGSRRRRWSCGLCALALAHCAATSFMSQAHAFDGDSRGTTRNYNTALLSRDWQYRTMCGVHGRSRCSVALNAQSAFARAPSKDAQQSVCISAVSESLRKCPRRRRPMCRWPCRGLLTSPRRNHLSQSAAHLLDPQGDVCTGRTHRVRGPPISMMDHALNHRSG